MNNDPNVSVDRVRLNELISDAATLRVIGMDIWSVYTTGLEEAIDKKVEEIRKELDIA